MNCKPGDLAVIRAPAGYVPLIPDLIGRVVRVVRLALDGESFQALDGTSIRVSLGGYAATWVVEAASPLPWVANSGKSGLFVQRPMADAFLRPLRDSDGEDETLQWAGKPQEVTA